MKVASTSIAVVALSLLPFVAAAQGGGELEWIGELPGITSSVEKSTGSAEKGVYTLSGDVAATFQKIHEGLTSRGWKIQKSSALGSMRTLTATKGSGAVKIVTSGSPGAVSLFVKQTGDASGGGAPAAAPSKESAGPPYAILENNQSRNHECKGNDVAVNGNGNTLTLTGRCGIVAANGNQNQIRVNGSAAILSANGNKNQILWSAKANPTAPATNNSGNENVIKSVP